MHQGGEEIYDSGCVGTRGWRESTVALTGSGTELLVQVEPNCDGSSGTAWKFEVACDGLEDAPDDDEEEQEQEQERGKHGWGIRGAGITVQAWPDADRNVRPITGWSASQASYSLVDADGQLEVSRYIQPAENKGALRIGTVLRNITDHALDFTFVEAFDPAGKECVQTNGGDHDHGAGIVGYAESIEPADAGGVTNVSGSGESCEGEQQHLRMEQALALQPGEHQYVEVLVAAGGSVSDLGFLPSFSTEPIEDEDGEANPPVHVRGTEISIIGGDTTEIRQHPWMVSIGDFFGTWNHRCGGTLIAPDAVVTAAHCFSPQQPIDRLRVLAGSATPRRVPEDGPHIRAVRSITVHPAFCGVDDDSADIAIVRLASPLELGPTVATISVNPEMDPLPGEQAEVTGWGLTERVSEEGGALEPTFLQRLSVTIRDPSFADDLVAEEDYLTADEVERSIVADGEFLFDVCSGDSGGPLTDADRTTLLGVVSSGSGPWHRQEVGGCGAVGTYTSVARHREWIYTTLANEAHQLCCLPSNPDC